MDRNLEIVTAASMGGLTTWRARHAVKLGSPCANCGTALEGPYCHACGQLAEDFDRSLGSLLAEVFENLFHADGRLFHTLPRLILRPAALTRDYLAGKRASQMPPLRLFLVVILVFFFAGSLRQFVEPSHVTWLRADAGDSLPARLGAEVGPMGGWLKSRLSYTLAHPREFAMAMEGWLHRLAIVFLPVATLLLSLLFVFRRRLFVFDHAIFSMHSLAFMGLLFTSITLVRLAPPLRGPADLMILVAPVHLFAHMRGVYRTGVLGTLTRMFVLAILSALSLAVLVAGVALLEFSGMGA